MTPVPRCDHCHEVIGVYEPMIIVKSGEVRLTSRAADVAVTADIAERYHRTCYLERGGTGD